MEIVQNSTTEITEPAELHQLISSALQRIAGAIAILNESENKEVKQFDTLIEIEEKYRLFFTIVPIDKLNDQEESSPQD